MRVHTLSATVLTAFWAWHPSFAQQFSPDNLAPYIPSPQEVVERMLSAARVKPGELVYDLGSGDGRIIITAAQKFHARAVGVELRGDLCKSTQARLKSLGLDDQVKLIHGNLLKVDLSPADVVTLYLLTSSNERLRPNLEKYLKPGARVVSNDYEIKGWTPSGIVPIEAGGLKHYIYVYEVGARN
ncbi:MAG: methyltransferase domain-containing protein [Bryobacteraceae bacterium]|jgi:protein-L-isoaspartate O-methyltransferase